MHHPPFYEEFSETSMVYGCLWFIYVYLTIMFVWNTQFNSPQVHPSGWFLPIWKQHVSLFGFFKILCRLHTLPGLCTTLSWERERVISSRLITTAMWLCMYIIRCHALMKKCKNFGRSASLWLWKTGGQVAHWFACRMCERYWWWWSSYQLSTWWVNSNLVLRSARCVHRVALSRFAAGYLRPVRRTHGPPCHNVSKGFGPNGWAGEFRGCETQFCCLTVLTC